MPERRFNNTGCDVWGRVVCCPLGCAVRDLGYDAAGRTTIWLRFRIGRTGLRPSLRNLDDE